MTFSYHSNYVLITYQKHYPLGNNRIWYIVIWKLLMIFGNWYTISLNFSIFHRNWSRQNMNVSLHRFWPHIGNEAVHLSIITKFNWTDRKLHVFGNLVASFFLCALSHSIYLKMMLIPGVAYSVWLVLTINSTF